MSSKRSLIVRIYAGFGLILAVGAVLGGCALGEKPQQTQVLVLGSDETACLDGSSQIIDDYLSGKLASDSKIQNLGDCTSNALKLFSQRVRGSLENIYTPEEIRDFIQHYFIKDMIITDDLLARLMEFKQVLVGGANNQITLAELNKARSLISLLTRHAIALRPYMPILPSGIASQPIGSVSRATLDQVSAVLNAAASDLGSVLQQNGNAYTFTQLDQLLLAYQSAPCAIGTSDGLTNDFIQRIRNYLNLGRQFKSSFVGPDSDEIASSGDWKYVTLSVVQWYGDMLRVSRLIKSGDSMVSGSGLDDFHAVVTDVLKQLGDSVQRHNGAIVTFEQLDTLVDALPDSMMMLPYNPQPGDGVTRATMKGLLPVFVQRFLGGRVPGPSGRDATGLTSPAIERFGLVFENWFDEQKLLENLYQHVASGSGSPFEQGHDRQTLLGSNFWSSFGALPDSITDLNDNDPAQKQELEAARLKALLGFGQPTYFNGDNPLRPLFAGDDGEITYKTGILYSFHDLTDLNWISQLARLMIEGYAQDPARANSDAPGASVSFAEFAGFFNDVSALGVELKFFNPNTLNSSALSRFREANLFTFSGNGDGYMDLREAMQMLAQVFSAKRLSLSLYSAISAKCPTGRLDEYNYPLLDSACTREQMLENYATFYQRMPNLVKFLNNESVAGRKQFFLDVETASRLTPDVGWSDSDLIDHYAAIMQYIETVYQRFDLNGDGILTKDEADNAFGIFKGSLGNLSKCQGKSLSDSELDVVFNYMISSGKIPKDFWDFVGAWVGQHLAPGDVRADRGRLVKIFAFLGGAPSTASNNPACNEP